MYLLFLIFCLLMKQKIIVRVFAFPSRRSIRTVGFHYTKDLNEVSCQKVSTNMSKNRISFK